MSCKRIGTVPFLSCPAISSLGDHMCHVRDYFAETREATAQIRRQAATWPRRGWLGRKTRVTARRAGVMGAGIVINASIVGSNPTGLGIYSINLIRALARIRDDVTVYSSAPEMFRNLRVRIKRVPAAVRPELGMRGHLAGFCGSRACFASRSGGPGSGCSSIPSPRGSLGWASRK